MLLKSKFSTILLFVIFLLLLTNNASAHCDTMEGPVVKASQKALATGNINYVLIWVQPKDEQIIKTLFEKVLSVRKLHNEAGELADMYFFETVARIHRMGEGEPYTGIKPAGHHPEEGITQADNAIEKKSLKNIMAHIDKKYHSNAEDLFNNLQSRTNYKADDVAAGREYVKAYVHFIHFIEEHYGTDINQERKHHRH